MSGSGPAPLDVRTRFERFPLAIKGAFVMRGADGNPHAARVVEAAVARIPSGPRHPFAVEDRIVDVAPNRDLFVPFEAPVTDLASGWYVVASSIEVDGRPPIPFSSRPFTVPWPRNDVRRGTVPVDRALSATGNSIRVLRLEMGADSAAVVWEPVGDEDEDVTERVGRSLTVLADDRALDVLPPDAGRTAAGHGEHVVRTYPGPRAARHVEVVVADGTHPRSAVRVPLS